jgi:hypothetical protein
MIDHVEGFPVLEPGSPLLHRWVQPGTGRTLLRRNGSVGLVLAHNAQRFHDKVERLDQPAERHGAIDDGAYNHRPITGGRGWSKHATGCADDLNWSRHPYNTRPEKTFTAKQIRAIRKTLELYRDPVTGLLVVEWGGNWPSRPGSTAKPDPMHFQISSQVRMEHVERVARELMDTKRGKAILQANPGQRKVVLS